MKSGTKDYSAANKGPEVKFGVNMDIEYYQQ